jgi:hypothetical protein
MTLPVSSVGRRSNRSLTDVTASFPDAVDHRSKAPCRLTAEFVRS